MDIGSPNRAQGSQFPATVREGSLYNFNYDDEVQSSHLGHREKPLQHNMHVDELLKNVIENGQLVTNPSSSFPLECLNGTSFGNKSLNDMLMELYEEQQFNTSMENNHLHQSSLGKIDEYYVPPAAIADVQPLMPIDPMAMVSQQQQDWFSLQMQMQMQVPTINVHQQELQNQFRVSAYEMDYSENSMVAAMPSTVSESNGGSGVFGRKCMSPDEMMEKNFERKQKRMAKNRESAAKSRAKKQAYINRLEADKDRLRRTNCFIQRWKDIEARTGIILSPRYQLRRTSSMPRLNNF